MDFAAVAGLSVAPGPRLFGRRIRPFLRRSVLEGRMDETTLIAFQRAEFSKAIRLQAWVLIVQVVIALLACLAVVFDGATAAYIFAVAALVMTGVWVAMEFRFRDSREQADRARRANVFSFGLKQALAPAIQEEISEGFSVTARNAEPFRDPDYYKSKAPPGPARLAEMVEESVFWSKDLMRESAKLALLWVCLCLLLAIGAMLALILLAQNGVMLAAVRVICTLATLVVSMGSLGSAIMYHRAAHALEKLLVRFQILELSNYPLADLMFAITEYYALVERAPMFFPKVYELRKPRLQKQWAKYKGEA